MLREEIKFLEGPQSRWEDFKMTVKVLLDLMKIMNTIKPPNALREKLPAWVLR